MPPSHHTPCHLFVLPWSLKHFGGVNQVVISLAHAMLASGAVRPLVLICDWDAHRPVWEEMHGVQTVRWRIRPWPAQGAAKEKMVFLAWLWRFQPMFAHFCQVQQVATINLHYPGSVAFTLDHAVQRLRRPLPLVFSFHGSDTVQLQEASPAARAQWRAMLARADRLVVCSADLGRRVVQALGEGLPLQLVYNGIDASSFKALPEAASTAPQHIAGRVILSVGKFVALKGQDVLVRAFAQLAQNASDLQLVLVGADGNALQELRQLCVTEGLQERVHFFVDVPHPQVAWFFRQAHIFCLPSRQEAFGLVLLEAGAFSLPVIASSVGGIPELIKDRVHGLLVPADDVCALAAGLRMLLNDPQLGRQMAACLHQQIENRFTWTRTLEQYLAPRPLPAQDNGGQ